MKNENVFIATESNTLERIDERQRLSYSEMRRKTVYKAVVLRADTPDANGTIYPKAVMVKAVHDFIAKGRLGRERPKGTAELDDPRITDRTTPTHDILKLGLSEQGTVTAYVETLPTVAGEALAAKLARSMREPHTLNLSLQMRAVGTVTNGVVGPDLEILSFDFVANEPAIIPPALESGGFVQWPTDLHDDGQGGMVVVAVVRKDPYVRGWNKFPALFAQDYQIDTGEDSRFNPGMLACVPLGYSFGCWWEGSPHPDSSYYGQWECTRATLTEEGRALVKHLEALFKCEVELITYIDT